MVSYIFGNSVAYRTFPKNVKAFSEILGLKRFCPPYNSSFYTIRSVYYEFNHINFGPDDIAVFCVGCNDCIYRKDNGIQSYMMRELIEDTKKFGVEDDLKFYDAMYDKFQHKPRNELVQLFTFEQFEWYVDQIFSRVKKRGVVLSIVWYDPSNKNMGWAYNEDAKTTSILERKAREYGLKFIDLWTLHRPETIEDGVHLTEYGHKFVANLIREAISEIENEATP